MSLFSSLGDALCVALLSNAPQPEILSRLESTAEAYTGALERVLGAAPGSLHLVEMDMLQEWGTTT